MINQATPEAATVCGLDHKYSLASASGAPLVFLVHGRAGTYDVMWTFKRCLPGRCNIIAPQAFLADSIGGFSWWQVMDRAESSSLEHDIELAYLKLQTFISKSIEYYKLQPNKILAYGFSQGGVLLSYFFQRQPDCFDGVALLASFVSRPKLLPRSIDQAEPTKPKVFIAHGSKDQTLSIQKAYQGRGYLTGLGYQVDFVEDAVGHKVGREGMRRLGAWSSALI